MVYLGKVSGHIYSHANCIWTPVPREIFHWRSATRFVKTCCYSTGSCTTRLGSDSGCRTSITIMFANDCLLCPTHYAALFTFPQKYSRTLMPSPPNSAKLAFSSIVSCFLLFRCPCCCTPASNIAGLGVSATGRIHDLLDVEQMELNKYNHMSFPNRYQTAKVRSAPRKPTGLWRWPNKKWGNRFLFLTDYRS